MIFYDIIYYGGPVDLADRIKEFEGRKVRTNSPHLNALAFEATTDIIERPNFKKWVAREARAGHPVRLVTYNMDIPDSEVLLSQFNEKTPVFLDDNVYTHYRGKETPDCMVYITDMELLKHKTKVESEVVLVYA